MSKRKRKDESPCKSNYFADKAGEDLDALLLASPSPSTVREDMREESMSSLSYWQAFLFFVKYAY